MRRTEAAFALQGAGAVDGAVLSESAFVLRFFGPNGRGTSDDRLLIVNLGRDLYCNPAPEPLLAPPEEMEWNSCGRVRIPSMKATGSPELDDSGELEDSRSRRDSAEAGPAFSHGGVQCLSCYASCSVPGRGSAADTDALISREWLVTNGLGGYACGTVAGVITRRFTATWWRHSPVRWAAS